MSSTRRHKPRTPLAKKIFLWGMLIFIFGALSLALLPDTTNETPFDNWPSSPAAPG